MIHIISNYTILPQNDEKCKSIIIDEGTVSKTKGVVDNFESTARTGDDLFNNEISQEANEGLSEESNIDLNIKTSLNTDGKIQDDTLMLKQDNDSDSEMLDITFNSSGDRDVAYAKSEAEQEESTESTSAEVKSAKSTIERKKGLKVNLQKTTDCEKKCHQRMLNTREELSVCLKQENLLELQKYGEKQSGARKTRGTKIYTNYCKACPFKTKNKYDYLMHILDKHKDLAAEKKLPPAECISRGGEVGVVWFKCNDCSHVNKWMSDFKKHVLSHKSLEDVAEVFRCASCSYVTKSRKHLITHLVRHKGLVYKCTRCDFQTNAHWNLKKHVSNIHEKPKTVKIFKCPICPYETSYKYGVRRHMPIHNEKRKMYECPLCPFKTPHKANLTNSHMTYVHKKDQETRVFNCDICSFKGKTEKDLRVHTLVHKNPDEVTMFKCPSCPFQTKYKFYLKRHSLMHEVPDPKGHNCDLCDYKGQFAVNLRIHIRNVHRDPSVGKMHRCTECPYQSRYKAVFRNHLLQHKPIKERTKFRCEDCGFISLTKENLKLHWENMHRKPEEIRKFMCAKCNFQTKHKENLKVHITSQHLKHGKKRKRK